MGKINKINYVIGDATNPQGEKDEIKLIVHVCNNLGRWGAGFVLALSNKWDRPEKAYRNQSDYILGMIDMVEVEDDTFVINLIGQEGTISNPTSSLPPIRYVAIEGGLKRVVKLTKRVNKKFSIHMPRIGSGLAGGNWKIIERIIEETLIKSGLSVTVYDLPTK